MGKIKLTNRAVDTLVSGNCDTFWWDQNLSGFGLKVTPAGTKTFLVQYRMGGRGTSTRRFSIGKAGVWNAKSARTEAERILRLVATGNDPREVKKERNRLELELSFASYAEQFLAIYGKRYWRDRTFESRAGDLRRWVVPKLRAKSLQQITKRDIAAVLEALPANHPSLPRNVFAVVRKLFTWAVERDDLGRSPCDGIRRPKAVDARSRVLDDDELMLVAAFSFDLGKPFGPFVRMLLVTGQRRDEVAGLQWQELDQARRTWTLPPARSKNKREHILPLGDIAMRGLDDMAGGGAWPKTGLVFSTNGKTPISGFSRMKRRLDQAIVAADGPRTLAPWRLHDLRRTMATNLQRLGVRFEVAETLLNHVGIAANSMMSVYGRHDWGSEKIEAITLWNNRIENMTDDFVKARSE